MLMLNVDIQNIPITKQLTNAIYDILYFLSYILNFLHRYFEVKFVKNLFNLTIGKSPALLV